MWRLVDKVSGKAKSVYSAAEEDITAVIGDSTQDDIASQGDSIASEGEPKSKDSSKREASGLDSGNPFAISTSGLARQSVKKSGPELIVQKRTHTTRHVFSSHPMEGLQWYGNILLSKNISEIWWNSPQKIKSSQS